MNKLLVVLLAAVSISVSAASFEANDRKIVDEILTPWIEKVITDPHKSMELMPPQFFDVMAKKSNTSVEEFKKMMLTTMDSVYDVVEIVSYSIDLDKAEAAKSNNGRDYAFIPQVTKLKQKSTDEEMIVEGYMLGIEDDGKWYFINWEPLYAPIIAEMYPDLKDLKAPQ